MLVKLILALFIVSITTACAAPVPPELKDCKIHKIWPCSALNEGWRPDHNVSAFSVKNGILSFTNTGSDPWIINTTPGSADTSSYHFLGIKMRSSVSGSNQIYFATDESPLGESTVIQCPVRGDGQFHFYEVNLSQLKTWKGKLTTLRIDPVNGGSEVGAKVDIDWIALYQVPARITIGRPYTWHDGSKNIVTIPVRNIGGEPSQPGIIKLDNNEPKAIRPVRPNETCTVNLEFQPKANPETMRIRGVFGGRKRFNIEMSTGQAMDVYTAVLAYLDKAGVINYIEVLPTEERARVSRAKRSIDGGTATFTLNFNTLPNTRKMIVTTALNATIPIKVLRFEGPRIEFSSSISNGHALFPGLEYLDANEPSSASAHIGPKLADRHVPHPYKITVPVMAVETEVGVIGVSWDPLQEWAPGHALPCAEFEVPNRSEGGANTLMTVFAPSIPDYVDENSEFARQPYTLKPGQAMKLTTTFFISNGKISDVIPDYYASHGIPKAPPIAGGAEGTIDTCFKAYTQSLYSAEVKGWKSHFGMGVPYSFKAPYAALVLGESLRKSDPTIARRCDIDPNAQIALYTGPTLGWFTDDARKAAREAISKQSADGGFPYSITEEQSKRVKEFADQVGIDATTLGTIGETNSGLICRELNGILDYALRTADRQCIEAGLKGLEKLNTYTVPRGAQTWEVHAHTPDIYAAAIAVDANVKGYHLTGDAKYLDAAKFWAQTGLPFVYSWAPPISSVPAAVLHLDENGEGKHGFLDKPTEFYIDTHRHVLPGASIAVFGTSFYMVNWFGTPVQWCGLAWANSVREYVKLQPDPVLKAVADAVFASGTQQQFDKGFAAGTYPDSWNLASNTVNTAFIVPDSIISYAYSLIDEKHPASISIEGIPTPAGRAYFNTYALIEDMKSSTNSFSAELKWYANQDLYTCIANSPEPARVNLDGTALARVTDLAAAVSGYYYDSTNKALHIKYRTAARTAKVEVDW